MAGRGKGKSTSNNTEKSEKVELPPVKPPPDYPDITLTHFEMTNELEYLVELKRGFVESMRNSAYYLQLEEEKKDIERYSDCYRETIKEKSVREIVDCDWSMFPAELAPSSERKKTALKTKSDKKEMIKAKRKKPRPIDDDDDDDDGGNKQNTEVKLQQQKSQQAQNNTDKEMKNIKEEEEEEEDSENMEEYEEVDQEMDYGTDYLNNYFDNGEDLDDDDDNPDDGPVY